MNGRLRSPQPIAAIFAGLIAPAPDAEYRGTAMRSRLETAFARHLDRQGIGWTYEPQVFSGYLPDFELHAGDVPTFVEVKPTLLEAPRAKRRMEPIWLVHPEALLMVACAQGCRWFGAIAGGPWREWTERWEHQ